MITTGFLNIILGLVSLLTLPLKALGDVSLPAGLTSALGQIGAYLIALDTYIPVASILAILVMIITVDGSIFGYKIIMWIVKRFPTQS